MRSANDQTAVFTLRITRRKLDRFREIVEGEHRTVSQEFRRFVDERIADDEVETEEKAA